MADAAASITIHRFWREARRIKASNRRADPAKLAQADMLDKAGVDAKEIQALTGWVKAENGKWITATTDLVMDEIDWIEYSPFGRESLQRQQARVADLEMDDEELRSGDPSQYAFMYRKLRWDAVRPSYDAWKSGHEIVDQGTSFGVWPGITPVQAERLRHIGIKTVEDLATRPVESLFKAQIPGIDRLQKEAASFLIARDQQHVADELMAKDEELEAMRQNQKEMAEMVVALMKDKEARDSLSHDDGSDEMRPRRGRPPRVSAEQDAA